MFVYTLHTTYLRTEKDNYNSSTFFRSYISFDILRRILSNYFGYDVLYVMNITDIDDKIIKRARQTYLYDRYVKEIRTLDQLLEDAKQVLSKYKLMAQKINDNDKKEMMFRLATK